MAEIVKHTLGFCGEHFHPNIWHLLIGGFGISTILSYIVLYIKWPKNQEPNQEISIQQF